MDVAAQNVSNVYTLGRILADHCLDLLLIGGIDLVAMDSQERLVVDFEDHVVRLEVVETHTLVLNRIEDGLKHGVDSVVVTIGSHHVHPAQILFGSGLVASNSKAINKEVRSQIHQELLIQVGRQDSGAGTVGAHGQQLVQATVAVHEIASEKDDDTLSPVGLA